MKIYRIFFLIFSFLFFLVAGFFVKAPETSLMSAFLTSNSNFENKIAKMAEISSNRLNVILEADNEEALLDLRANFEESNIFVRQIGREIRKEGNSNAKKLAAPDFSFVEIYKNHPKNFLSQKAKKLLKEKKYEEIRQKSMEMLYNPLGVYIAPIETDPYLFATDFVLDLDKTPDIIEFEGKFYSVIQIEIEKTEDVQKIKNIAIENSNDDGRIFLAGAPVHGFDTAKKSSLELNIICLISILGVFAFSRLIFGNFKILLPIFLSIAFGFFTGFLTCSVMFQKIHILTFVFSASLIGISLDYSLHYYLSGAFDEKNHCEKKFKKSLLISLLTTVLTFGALYFSDVEILKQIAIFVSFGLFGVYLFVVFILPLFKVAPVSKQFSGIEISKFKKAVFFLILTVILMGFCKLKFDDNIKNLYKPSKELILAENTYKNITKNSDKNFIFVEGENLEDILEKEENIKAELQARWEKSAMNKEDDKKLDTLQILSLSDFIPSKKAQNENIQLIEQFYKKDGLIGVDFLTEEQKQALTKNKGEIFEPENFPLNDKFLLDKNTSFIMVNLPVTGAFQVYNPTVQMTKILKKFRWNCLKILPLLFALLYLLLRAFYTGWRAAKILLPSFLGAAFSIAAVALFSVPINVFHLFAFILVVGFSMDYSIFRAQGGRNSSLAVLISCASTAVSFLLIAFTSFKVISSLGLILSIGVSTSYILSLLLIDFDEAETPAISEGAQTTENI